MAAERRSSRHGARMAVSTLAVLAASLGTSPMLEAQEGGWTMSGGVGVVVVDERFGGSVALGPRLRWHRLVVSGLGEIALVRGEGDRGDYRWEFSGGEYRCISPGGGTVNDAECLNLDLRVGALVDASFALARTDNAWWLIGGGYRVGHARTTFASVGVMGRDRPWLGRMLLGPDYFQLHVGLAYPLRSGGGR